jgi:putative hydrolases of HD superfamily
MTLAELTEKKVLEETARLQYLYGLKKVIRYDQDRHETDSTESVAEHVYGMLILAQYFLPLENPEGDWDRARLYEMITLHDIDEIETGDMLGYQKTAETRALELAAMKRTIENAPVHMQAHMNRRVTEYETRETREARFAKAIDKIEPLFQIFNEEGRAILKRNKTTAEQSLSIKTSYVKDFPYIKRFTDVIHDALIAGDYYWRAGE